MYSKKPTILITAPTGFIIRNLILGKFTDTISQHANLVISTQSPEDVKNLDKIKKYNVKVIEYPIIKPIENRGIVRLTSVHYIFYLLSVGAKNNESIFNYAKVYDNKSNKLYNLIKNIIILIGRLIFKIGLFKYLVPIYELKYSKHQLTKYWIEKLSDFQPDMVLTTLLSLAHANSPSNDLPVVLAAKKLKIPIATLIQSWDNLSTKPSIFPLGIHQYYVWSETQQQEVLTMFPWTDKESVTIVGAVQFDFHNDTNILLSREDFLTIHNIPIDKKYLLFTTGMPKTLPNEIEEFYMIIKRLHKEYPELHFIIRLHPKDHSSRINQIEKELIEKNAHIQYSYEGKHMDEGGVSPPEEFYQLQVNTIKHAEIVINSSSTMTVDAAIMDKPIICIAYNYINDPLFPEGRSLALSNNIHYRRLVHTGGVFMAYSEEQLIEGIQSFLTNRDIHKEERKKIIDTVSDPIVDSAGIKLAISVAKLVEKSKLGTPHGVYETGLPTAIGPRHNEDPFGIDDKNHPPL